MPFDTPITRTLGRLQPLIFQNRICDFLPLRYQGPHCRGSDGGSKRGLVSSPGHRRGRLRIPGGRYDCTPYRGKGKMTDLCDRASRLQERRELNRRIIPRSWITPFVSLGPPSNWRWLPVLAVGKAHGQAESRAIRRPRQPCPRNLARIRKQSQRVDHVYPQL